MRVIESSLEWQLKLICWEFFCSFTWDPKAHQTLNNRKRFRHIIDFFKGWAASEKRKIGDMIFVIRGERGELGGHAHAHALIAGFALHSINVHKCFQEMYYWKRGTCRIRLINPAGDDAEAYMSKGRYSDEWAQGANKYELRKFQAADWIYWSDAARRECICARENGVRMSPLLT